MPFVYLDTDQVFLDTREVIIGDDPTPEAPVVGFEVYRNGILEDILWSRSQLLSISLAISAYDGQIGTGSITVPGAPNQLSGWWIGDRITFYDPISEHILYTGYISGPRVSVNVDALDEVQTTWQLQDMNRQFIGRRVEDLTQPFPFFLDTIAALITAQIEGTGAPNPTLDQTWVGSSAATFPATTYNSDGCMDFISQTIQYTGYTVYLGLTDTENTFELHIHALNDGPTSDLTISDDPTSIGGDTIPPSLNETLTYNTADLKDGVSVRNGVQTLHGVPADLYAAGGIGWEATLDYGSADNDTLTAVYAQAVVNAALIPITFSTTLFHLIGEQVAGIRAGSLVPVFSAIGAPSPYSRVSNLTLTVTRDIDGNPLKGMWDVAVEVGAPLRGPTAVTGFGGQGGPQGALSTFTQWTRTQVFEDDPAIELDEQETVTAQLIDDFGIATPVPNVSIEWSVVKDDSDTPHPDYIVLVSPTVTDQSGQATATVVKTSETDSSKHRVKAEPS